MTATIPSSHKKYDRNRGSTSSTGSISSRFSYLSTRNVILSSFLGEKFPESACKIIGLVLTIDLPEYFPPDVFASQVTFPVVITKQCNTTVLFSPQTQLIFTLKLLRLGALVLCASKRSCYWFWLKFSSMDKTINKIKTFKSISTVYDGVGYCIPIRNDRKKKNK